MTQDQIIDSERMFTGSSKTNNDFFEENGYYVYKNICDPKNYVRPVPTQGGLINYWGRNMKKLSIIRFKPKPENFDEFVKTLKNFISQPGKNINNFIMTKDEEVFSVVIRHADQLESDAKQGVEYLNTVRHMLQEYNETDRHTIPLTGDLVE